MRKLPLILLLVAAGLLAKSPQKQATSAPKKPKLVLALVFDQFRYDYLTRFKGEYTGGFATLLNQGAVFTDARLIHFPTVTAIGHSTLLTGALPATSGIVGNEWFDPEDHARVTSVSDPKTKLLGGSGAGSSPRRLLVDTVGDELKMATSGKARVIGISLKDRASILPAGHMADAAYWFDPQSGNFVSSTFYFPELPAWVRDFNASRPGDQYKEQTWLNHKMPAGGTELYNAIEASPFGNDMLERFAERAMTAEQLGSDSTVDILAVSFSATDYVGHSNGPFSAEEHETVIQTDRILKRLLDFAERQAGAGNVLVVMTADHGVAPAPPRPPETSRLPGGRIAGNAAPDAIQTALSARYGEGKWVQLASDLSIYLNRELADQKKLDMAEVRRAAAQAVLKVPHVSRVYTWDQLQEGRLPGDPLTRPMQNGFNSRRGADLQVVPDPYWIIGNSTTTHGTPYGYDTHIPIVFMGPGIRPGHYDERTAENDIAPTLATILEVEIPSGAVGRVLREMLVR